MRARSSAPTETAERDLVITRVFNAPRDLVWKAFTRPEHLGHWRTTLTIRTKPINATETEREAFYDGESSVEQGFAGTFERLDEYLASL